MDENNRKELEAFENLAKSRDPDAEKKKEAERKAALELLEAEKASLEEHQRDLERRRRLLLGGQEQVEQERKVPESNVAMQQEQERQRIEQANRLAEANRLAQEEQEGVRKVEEAMRKVEEARKKDENRIQAEIKEKERAEAEAKRKADEEERINRDQMQIALRKRKDLIELGVEDVPFVPKQIVRYEKEGDGGDNFNLLHNLGAYDGIPMVNTLRLGINPIHSQLQQTEVSIVQPNTQVRVGSKKILPWVTKTIEDLYFKTKTKIEKLFSSIPPFNTITETHMNELARITKLFDYDLYVNPLENEAAIRYWYIDLKLLMMILNVLENDGELKFQDVINTLTQKTDIKDEPTTFVATEFDGFTNFLIHIYIEHENEKEKKKSFFQKLSDKATQLKHLAKGLVTSSMSAEKMIMDSTHVSFLDCLEALKINRRYMMDLETGVSIDRLFAQTFLGNQESKKKTLEGIIRDIVDSYIAPLEWQEDFATYLKDRPLTLAESAKFVSWKESAIKSELERNASLSPLGRDKLLEKFKHILQRINECFADEIIMPFKEIAKKYS